VTRQGVHHDTIRIERRYAAAPGRVFRAWADPEQLIKWWGP
jgi:uncharacterized protein YndB with AHSA1/START domain